MFLTQTNLHMYIPRKLTSQNKIYYKISQQEDELKHENYITKQMAKIFTYLLFM